MSWKRVVGVVALLVAAGLALHAYVRRSPAARCPFGYDTSATPEQRAAARRAFSSTHRGTIAARSRAALAWKLDETTRDELLAWARANDAACTARGLDLECSHAAGLSALWLGVDEASRLVAVTAFHDATDAGEVSALYRAIVTGETERAGAPVRIADHDVARGPLVQSTTEWRFGDAWARAVATNMGRGHFVLVEEYRSLRIN